MKRIRDFVAVDPALQPDPSAWEGLDRSRPAEHTVETRIRIVVYSKHNYVQAYFGIMDLYFSHLLELVSAVPYLPGCRFAAYQVTQGGPSRRRAPEDPKTTFFAACSAAPRQQPRASSVCITV